MGFAYLLRHNDAHQIDPAVSNPQTRLTPLHETEPRKPEPATMLPRRASQKETIGLGGSTSSRNVRTTVSHDDNVQ